MELFENIVYLLVGLVVFVTGMNMMSSGLKKSAGRSIRLLFKKIKDNRVAAVGIGAGTTAIIQSSGATMVMVVGFLTAGAITFSQGFSLMMGSFLGTTITGILVALSGFPFSKFLMLLAFVGFVLCFFKNSTIKSIGEIFIGFGILFFGLNAMSTAFKYAAIQEFIINLINNINLPILLLIIGALLTAITQSSSATNGIVIVMVSTNPTLLGSGIYLVLGATIGAMMPTIIASLKANTLAKRVTYMSLLMRSLVALLITIILWILTVPVSNLLGNVNPDDVGMFLALFTVVYNLIYIILLLPFTSKFELLANKLFKDKDEIKKQKALSYINDNLLNTPSVAIIQVKKEIENMLYLAKTNFFLSFEAIFTGDISKYKEIEDREENIDSINSSISDYLIKLSAKASLYDEAKIGGYYHVINDIERIGDHAYNFIKMAAKLREEDLKFSETATKEFAEFKDTIALMFELSDKIFMDRNKKDLIKLHDLEDKTDQIKETISNAHFERIKRQECNNSLSPFHSTLVSELERVADHLTNIGYSIVNPNGDDTDHKKK